MNDSKGLSAISMNAQVDLDDVASIFIARFETGLHDQQAAIQRELKEVQKNRQAVEDEVKTRVEELLAKTFHNFDGPFANITHVIKVNTVGPADRRVLAEIIQKTSTPVDCTVHIYTSYNYEAGQHDGHKTTMKVAVDMLQSEVDAITNLDDQINGLREQLVQVNNELKGLDRKVRQVKATIAEKKLHELGMTDLLESPELLKLIQQ